MFRRLLRPLIGYRFVPNPFTVVSTVPLRCALPSSSLMTLLSNNFYGAPLLLARPRCPLLPHKCSERARGSQGLIGCSLPPGFRDPNAVGTWGGRSEKSAAIGWPDLGQPVTRSVHPCRRVSRRISGFGFRRACILIVVSHLDRPAASRSARGNAYARRCRRWACSRSMYQ